MEPAEITRHAEDILDLMIEREINATDAVVILTVTSAALIAVANESSHDRARCVNSVLTLLANRTGVAIRTRHLADDGSDKKIN